MSPADRRRVLEESGLEVCRNSFPGSSGPLWYVRRPDPAGGVEPVARMLVDLESGSWRTWDDATRREWGEGPWIAPAEPAVESGIAADDDPLKTPFVRECLTRGFEWLPGQTLAFHSTPDGWDTENRYLLFRGRKYLALSRQREIQLAEYMSPWDPRPLEQFLADQEPASRPVVTPRVPRPFVYGQPVEVPVGRSQTLF